MGDQTQAYDIFQTPLSSGYPLPLIDKILLSMATKFTSRILIRIRPDPQLTGSRIRIRKSGLQIRASGFEDKYIFSLFKNMKGENRTLRKTSANNLASSHYKQLGNSKPFKSFDASHYKRLEIQFNSQILGHAYNASGGFNASSFLLPSFETEHGLLIPNAKTRDVLIYF